MKNTVIQVFEYQTLRVGENEFSEKHFDGLVKFNDRNNRIYFEVGHKEINFRNYVGVIKVGNLSIEILPKADRSDDSQTKEHWQKALIEMLYVCRRIKTKANNKANLRVKNQRLLDVIFTSFLFEVSSILHTGKIKKYRIESSNINNLKGKLNFSKNISENYIHKERFYTDHQKYDFNNFLNRVLKIGLTIISKTAISFSIRNQCKRFMFDFDEVNDTSVLEKDFENIKYDRNSQKYKDAIELAKLIIFNYQPDISTGRNNVIALLFDMNMLFEEYVYYLLRRTSKSENWDYDVSFQQREYFWNDKRIIPDIILTNKATETQCIIDTKWKIPRDNKPSDNDLKQMFVYNVQFGAERSCLVYPYTKQETQEPIAYADSKLIPGSPTHSCQMMFFNIFDNDKKLDRNAANQIYENLTNS